MDIIQRHQWHAQHPDGFGPAPLPAREVWLHHSVTPAPGSDPDDEAAAVRGLERIGQDRFGSGISYTFVIPPSGRVYEGHSVGREGAHTYGHNDIGRAICLIGNYETDPMTNAQKEAIAALLRHGHDRGWWTTPALTGGHRDLKATACPGQHAYARIDEINRRAREEDDMPSADEVATAVWNHWIGNRRLGRDEYAETLLGSAEDRIIRQQIAPLRGQVSALAELVRQLADRADLDMEAVERAAKAGVRRALEEGIVDVDVTVTGGQMKEQQ